MTDIVFADVSRHQGAVNWAAYAAAAGSTDPNGLIRVAAGICKATDGTTWVDPQFAVNRTAMRKQLQVRGYYHYFEAADDPVVQAKFFAQTVGRLQPGEFAVLDVEQDTQSAKHEQFCAEVDRLSGGRCWIYGGMSVPNPQERPFWVARYPANGHPDPALEPSVAHVLWQFSSTGAFPGVQGVVDLNVHRGTLATLAQHALA